MVLEKQAQIYKSDQRGCIESEIFRRHCTFNFDHYKSLSRNPFGTLVALNDETLSGGNQILRHLETDTNIVLIPLVGGIVYKDSLGHEDIVGTGQARFFSAQKFMSYEIINPFPDDLVNYLQIWFRPEDGIFTAQSAQTDFDLSVRNKMISIVVDAFSETEIGENNSNTSISIGIFDGRKEGIYTLKNPENGLFAFVINGAFEFENRLIESRDGLALSGITETEFEALSENAILLILEIPIN